VLHQFDRVGEESEVAGDLQRVDANPGRPLGLLLAWWLLAAPASAGDRDSPWLTSYAEARATARLLGKPIFVVFRCEH
jgi:hypothetical protein